MFCTNCGFINPTDAHYCQSCGHHFQMQTVSIPAPAITSPAPTDSETPEVADLNQETNIKVQQPNFLVKHWRGDYSLGFSYWVIGSLLTIVVVAIATAVGSMKEMQEFGPRASGFIILAFYGFALPLTLWQLVGIWRSADKHGQRSGKSFWANLAKISVLLGFLRAIGEFSGQGIPLITEGTKMIAGIDNTPNFEIRLLHDGTELELAGGMPFGTTEAVTKFLDATPAIQIIHLNSQGGRMGEAFKLYKTIKERNLITYTSAECVSACSIAFLAGRERYLAENAKLGFHSISIAGLDGEIVKEGNEEVRQTLKSHGVPDSFIDRALSTSSKDMWYPSKEELLNTNVITTVVDSKYFGLSGVSQWRDANKIESALLANSAFSALAQYDQKNYSRLRKILVDGVQKGKTGVEIQNEIHSILVNELIQSYLKKAPDEPLIRYWRSQIEEWVYLAKQNPRNCADLAFPQFASSAIDLQAPIPNELQAEDLDALAGLIKGAATNPQEQGSNPQIQADSEAVLMKIGEKYPWVLPVFQNSANYKDDPDSLCGAVILFYSEILAIPNNRSGPLLRHIASS